MPYRCGGHAFPHDREGTVRNLFAPRRHLGPRGHHRQRPSASFPERTFHIPFFPTQRLHRPHHFILLVRGVAPPSALPHRRDTDRPLSRQQQHHHTNVNLRSVSGNTIDGAHTHAHGVHREPAGWPTTITLMIPVYETNGVA